MMTDLNDRKAESVKRSSYPFARSLSFLRQIVVADVGGEVYGESDAHYQVDQGHSVKSNAPPSHVPED